jgi:spermidine/putrescine-binding protein
MLGSTGRIILLKCVFSSRVIWIFFLVWAFSVFPLGVRGAEDQIKVPILDKTLTRAELIEQIKKEGEVIVGNWTYTANDTLVDKFKEYVTKEYGVEVEIKYLGTQEPGTYLTNLYTAQKAGNPAPYDVLAIEENYYHEALSHDVVQPFLPSDLVPNLKNVLPSFVYAPNAVAFQATASPGIVYNKDKAGFLKDWKDLADPRLKGKLTLAKPGDITAAGFLIGLCWSLGGDYKKDEDMKKAIDFAVDKIGPNVVKYTTSSSEMQQLLRSEAVHAVMFWNSLARLEFLEGYESTAFLNAESGQAMANGFAWIPKNAPHPVLAQIFINFELSDERQVPPDSWKLEKGPWAEFHEGLLGPHYEGLLPDWIKPYYSSMYPSLEIVQKQYKPVDWNFVGTHMDSWMKYYEQRLQ